MSERDYQFTQDSANDLDTRWKLVEPYWNSVRTTGYGQAIRLAAREMHGVCDIDCTTYRALSDAISAASQSGLYDDVLTDQAGIRAAINDTGSRLDQDRRYFAPAYRFNRFFHLTHRNQVLDLEERVEMSIHTLADLERAVERDFESAVRGGMVAVKNADAYHRRIKFDKTPRHDAEVIFNKITGPIARKQTSRGLGLDETRPLYDYLWFHILALCEASDMPVQLQTGHFASPGVLTDSYPLLLANLFMEFPRVKFVLFHGGFPFVAELGTLGKNFRNVFLDLCWLHIISPRAAADALDLWLEFVPSHKIMGFGGDDRFVESSYAQSCSRASRGVLPPRSWRAAWVRTILASTRPRNSDARSCTTTPGTCTSSRHAGRGRPPDSGWLVRETIVAAAGGLAGSLFTTARSSHAFSESRTRSDTKIRSLPE